MDSMRKENKIMNLKIKMLFCQPNTSRRCNQCISFIGLHPSITFTDRHECQHPAFTHNHDVIEQELIQLVTGY